MKDVKTTLSRYDLTIMWKNMDVVEAYLATNRGEKIPLLNDDYVMEANYWDAKYKAECFFDLIEMRATIYYIFGVFDKEKYNVTDTEFFKNFRNYGAREIEKFSITLYYLLLIVKGMKELNMTNIIVDKFRKHMKKIKYLEIVEDKLRVDYTLEAICNEYSVIERIRLYIYMKKYLEQFDIPDDVMDNMFNNFIRN